MRKTCLFLLASLVLLCPIGALADGYYYGQGYTGSDCAYTYSPYYATSYVCNVNPGNVNQNQYTYPYSTYPSYPNYPPSYTPYYPSYPSLTLTSLSESIAAPGSTITVYGSGFDPSSNVVYLGGQASVSVVPSYTGTSLSFTIPSYISGSIPVSVSNARGTSNSLFLTVQPYGYSYGYPYNYNTCSYYNNCTQQSLNTTFLGNLGQVSAQVTGPSTLAMNTIGTWTLLLDDQNSQYLSASVSWGDGNTSSPQTIYGLGQQTITFTHVYSNYGTFAPSFTITNASGASQSLSAPAVSVSY